MPKKKKITPKQETALRCLQQNFDKRAELAPSSDDVHATISKSSPVDIDVDADELEKNIATLSINNGNTRIRYILCLDIEATFDGDKSFSHETHEVIELPCILADIKEGKIIDEFHTFVKPSLHPQLTNECIALTGITQVDVDNAPTFREAIQLLDGFMKKHSDKLHPPPQIGSPPPNGWPNLGPRNYVWVTDGHADIERFLCLRSCRINRVRLPAYISGGYIDMKLLFKTHFKERGFRRLPDMLAKWGLSFEGREHSGLQDARQVARIMLFMVQMEAVQLKCNRSIVMEMNLSFAARQL
ncbi:ribonuclease H-like domain-containing protein [Lipomyces chichibuensis]|uniref:ribonuclease H-like domain-containing protein n=1 Tax=Lipomyces chichibuensis TaxID=1546026 RepID=UPI00334362B0